MKTEINEKHDFSFFSIFFSLSSVITLIITQSVKCDYSYYYSASQYAWKLKTLNFKMD